MVVSPAAKALGEAYHIKCHPDWRSFTPQTTNQSLVAIHPLSLSLSLLEPQPPETPLSYLLLLLLPLPPRKKKKDGVIPHSSTIHAQLPPRFRPRICGPGLGENGSPGDDACVGCGMGR